MLGVNIVSQFRDQSLSPQKLRFRLHERRQQEYEPTYNLDGPFKVLFHD